MAVKISKFTSQEKQISILRFFSYNNKSPVGIIKNPHFQKDIYFENLTQMLLSIDYLQDFINYPLENMRVRRFTEPDEQALRWMETRDPPQEDKTIASFKLHILFRQNASWQGNLMWIDQGTSAQFRSALEMIFLIDSALESSDTTTTN